MSNTQTSTTAARLAEAIATLDEARTQLAMEKHKRDAVEERYLEAAEADENDPTLRLLDRRLSVVEQAVRWARDEVRSAKANVLYLERLAGQDI
jgi:hypothetical protein